MEDVVINTIRIKACGEFVIGKYRTRKDVLRRKDVREEQIMSALGKSKTFNVRDWFGDVNTNTFIITNIDKTKCGGYVYTIDYDPNLPTTHSPNINTIAYSISYNVLSA